MAFYRVLTECLLGCEKEAVYFLTTGFILLYIFKDIFLNDCIAKQLGIEIMIQ